MRELNFAQKAFAKFVFLQALFGIIQIFFYVIQPSVTQEAYIKGSQKVSAKINLQMRYFDPKRGNLRLNTKLKVQYTIKIKGRWIVQVMSKNILEIKKSVYVV